MYRGTFYPPGREKIHALGALDCALWDIKGKALDTPVYQLLGGRARDHVECYQSYGTLDLTGARAAARRVMDLGFRAVRFHGIEPEGGVFDRRRAVDETAAVCAEVREGVGPDGDWILDAHTRFDLSDAVRLCRLIEPLNPFFVEDPVRAITDPAMFRFLRARVNVPIAAGEQFGDRWDGTQPLVEQELAKVGIAIDARTPIMVVTISNSMRVKPFSSLFSLNILIFITLLLPSGWQGKI